MTTKQTKRAQHEPSEPDVMVLVQCELLRSGDVLVRLGHGKGLNLAALDVLAQGVLSEATRLLARNTNVVRVESKS